MTRMDLARIQDQGLQSAANDARMERVEQAVMQMREMMLAMTEEVARLNRALALMRVSRTQEVALNEAVRARARALCREEGIGKSGERKMAAAIRTTVRDVTGARAMGDVQAQQYEKTLQLIDTWRMAGAIRRIRREEKCANGTGAIDRGAQGAEH